MKLRLASAVLGAAMLMAIAAPAAFAADTVTQELTGGIMTASVADLPLADVAYSHSLQNSTGTMVLTADDSTGTGAGWDVTIQTSVFDYAGANGGTDIPAANFSITTADAPVATAGQAVDVTDGPKLSVAPTGALNTPRTVLVASANFGAGTYTQDLDVNLAVPAQSRVGTYTGTLTTTIS